MDPIATLTKRTIEVSPDNQGHRSLLTMFKKKDPGGWVRRPSEKVRQAVHEREETVQRRDARALKDRERHRCHLMAEGSENEDEENSDEGQAGEEDDLEDDDEGTHVGRPFILLCAALTKYHVQFSSRPVHTKLSEVPRQHLTHSSSKVPRVVGGNIPNPSGEVSTVLL